MEHKQNPNNFQARARKASGINRTQSVRDTKRASSKVSRGDRVLGDVLQKAGLETADISRPHDNDFTIYSR